MWNGSILHCSCVSLSYRQILSGSNLSLYPMHETTARRLLLYIFTRSLTQNACMLHLNSYYSRVFLAASQVLSFFVGLLLPFAIKCETNNVPGDRISRLDCEIEHCLKLILNSQPIWLRLMTSTSSRVVYHTINVEIKGGEAKRQTDIHTRAAATAPHLTEKNSLQIIVVNKTKLPLWPIMAFESPAELFKNKLNYLKYHPWRDLLILRDGKWILEKIVR